MDCRDHDAWSGLGLAELREEERRALVAHRAACPRCARAADEDRQVAEALSRLPDPPAATPPPALVRPARRGWRRGRVLVAAAAGAVAAVVAVAVVRGPQSSSETPEEASEPSLRLVAVARSQEAGVDVVRPIAGGMEVRGDEGLELRFVTTGSGYLSLWEEGPAGLSLLWPAPGEPWNVGPGEHRLGAPDEDRLLRHEGPPGARTFVGVLSLRPLSAEMAEDLARRPSIRGARATARLRVLWTGATRR